MSGWSGPKTRTPVGQDLLAQANHLIQPPRLLVGGGEIGAGGQGEGVVVSAEEVLPPGKDLFEQRDSLV